jgi:hypothetical protein
MVLVYAGRRVDAAAKPGGPPVKERFPASRVPGVAREVVRVLRELKPSTVVGSAACGTDLLVLEAAGELGLRRRVILPFDRATFRESSVTDRPGDWGSRYDAVIADVSAKGNLVELTFNARDDATYVQTNFEIFRDADTVARSTGEDCRALVVWNGAGRGAGDVTEAFLKEADRRGWAPEVIDTLT